MKRDLKMHYIKSEELQGIPHVGLTTDGGAVVTLHNPGKKRPTKYHLYLSNVEHGCFTLDTLVNENKPEHVSVKKCFASNGRQDAIKMLAELAEQKAEGTPENTAKYFRPIGLLYWDKSVE